MIFLRKVLQIGKMSVYLRAKKPELGYAYYY